GNPSASNASAGSPAAHRPAECRLAARGRAPDAAQLSHESVGRRRVGPAAPAQRRIPAGHAGT
ncbi:MAG: hypothetical protein ACRDPO_10650, partial [Streptosporangiaceae bacterium]